MAALGRPGYNLGHGGRIRGRRKRRAQHGANARRVLDAAWAADIRYFDAARSYGLGETFLGRWLEERAIPPAAVTVGSKWLYLLRPTGASAWGHRHRSDVERGQPGGGSSPSKTDRPRRGAAVRLCAGHVEPARTVRWGRSGLGRLALAQPWADIVLSGAVTMEQLQSNVCALDIGLDPAAMGALADLAEDPARYWETRSSLRWN